MARRPASLRVRILLLAIATTLALGLGELALHVFVGPPRTLGQLSYRDGDGTPFASIREAIDKGMVEALDPAETPRPRQRFKPGLHAFICYSDNDVLRRDWLDANGCVEVRINQFGLRERDDIRPDNKRPGERRIVCIGDSFTFGWGIPVEKCWVRLLEDSLRQGGQDVRTVNCGLSGALVTDEYQWGLEHRFGAFQPDCVIVSLCLNDLIPCNGLCLIDPAQPRPTGFLLLDYARLLLHRSGLALDPQQDWVDRLLQLSRSDSDSAGLTGPDAPYDAMWSQGTPQRSLAAMRDWCGQRKVRLLVVMWPFMQGLGAGEFYPFAKLHQLVGAFCQQEGIPFLDLLPALRDHPTQDLWVTPADLHPDTKAQLIVLPSLAAFVKESCGF